jgi:hypothetical protein
LKVKDKAPSTIASYRKFADSREQPKNSRKPEAFSVTNRPG